MALTKAFFEAVDTGNIRRVRIMMKNSLLVDQSFAEFTEMEKASESMNGLYDLHDGRELINDKSKWNDDYMDKIMVQVVSNFSHERLTHLKEVIQYLNPVTSTSKRVTSTHTDSAYRGKNHTAPKSSYHEQKYRDQKNGTYKGTKIATGAVAGAVVGGVAASIAGVTVVGGAIAGGVIGSAVVAIAINGGK